MDIQTATIEKPGIQPGFPLITCWPDADPSGMVCGPAVDNPVSCPQTEKSVDKPGRYPDRVHKLPTSKPLNSNHFQHKNTSYQHFHTPYTSSSSVLFLTYINIR
jgi:hypothetical protein